MSRKVSSAALAPGQSVTQFVIGQLLDGLNLKVTIDGEVYDGSVHNLDFAPGSGADYVFALVSIPKLNEGDGDDFDSVKVSIHRDGTVNVLPAVSSDT